MTELVIPDSVTRISSYAFYNCSSITSVVMGTQVTTVGSTAFHGCNNISAVYYMGTEAEWAGIEASASNAPLMDTTRYYYSEAQPTEVGYYWRRVDGKPTAW